MTVNNAINCCWRYFLITLSSIFVAHVAMKEGEGRLSKEAKRNYLQVSWYSAKYTCLVWGMISA